MAPTKNTRVIALFDVDGTLTPARKTVSAEMTARLQQLRQQITIGVVGGSDLVKQKEQLGENVVDEFDYSFSENGLVAFHNGVKVGETSLKHHFTNEQLNRFVNYVLRYIADLDIPIKRGTFLEFRMGMINVSPIGRNCSQDERDEFEKYDAIHNVRKTFVEALKKEFADYNLTFSVGGQVRSAVNLFYENDKCVADSFCQFVWLQISFDVFPSGWDKTYALRFLDPKDYDEIHFFGDKTHQGGNDYEIYTHERTIGHSVSSPEDTIRILNELFPWVN
ncbi:Phosphomannomutase b1, partial [Globisporangium splendens]